jgi:hypothetical protein
MMLAKAASGVIAATSSGRRIMQRLGHGAGLNHSIMAAPRCCSLLRQQRASIVLSTIRMHFHIPFSHLMTDVDLKSACFFFSSRSIE